MSDDTAPALKIANELMETLRINPHQRGSAWPIDLFAPLARDYLRLVEHKEIIARLRAQYGGENGKELD